MKSSSAAVGVFEEKGAVRRGCSVDGVHRFFVSATKILLSLFSVSFFCVAFFLLLFRRASDYN